MNVAYELGRRAFEQGKSNLDNPFDGHLSTIASHFNVVEWRSGWRDARDEMLASEKITSNRA